MFMTAMHHQEWIEKVQLAESNNYTFHFIYNAPTLRLNCKLSQMQMKKKMYCVFKKLPLKQIVLSQSKRSQ